MRNDKLKLDYMRILVTNDDGILSEALWILVSELRKVAEVIVVAPDREQSAIGTAVTLRQTLRVQKVRSLVPDIETYAVEGTPSDAVILALGKIIEKKVDLVISGINMGHNLGEDAYISGTVAAALQAYFRGFSSLAVSSSHENTSLIEPAAHIAAMLAKRIGLNSDIKHVLLNVNYPETDKINGIKLTRLASESHINTVEEGNDGRKKYYWLTRQQATNNSHSGTDVRAIESGFVSVTPLNINRNRLPILQLERLCSDVFTDLSLSQNPVKNG